VRRLSFNWAPIKKRPRMLSAMSGPTTHNLRMLIAESFSIGSRL
jgi:hypothetical protein